MDKKIIYKISAPYSQSAYIEVYGDPDMCWYEYRIVDAGKLIADSVDMQYGQAEIALRDALIAATENG